MRNEDLRRAVASMPCAVCGIHGYSQAAHSNAWKYGKGRGIKATDAAIFPLCCTRLGIVGCHEKFDQYKLFPKDVSDTMADQFIAETLVSLLESGFLKISKFRG